MRQVARLDSSGYFAADVLLEDGEPLAPDMVETGPPDGLFSPRWNVARSSWEEGMAPEKMLACLKDTKRAEMDAHMVEACNAQFGSPYIAIALIAAGESRDPRLVAAKDALSNWRRVYSEIDQAANVAELDAVAWS